MIDIEMFLYMLYIEGDPVYTELKDERISPGINSF